MKQVTIHSHVKQWEGAQVVGVGKDTFTGQDDVLVVTHPTLNGQMDFYAEPNAEGNHLNVGNNAYWVTSS
jgi:hypothetical protein